MTKRILFLIVLLAVWCPQTPIFAEKLSDSRTLRETIAFEGSGTQRLIVDNVWGSVVVHGYDGDKVEMVAEETVKARTSERIEQARREVEIAIRKRDGEIELYVDGPFRCQDRDEGGTCWKEWDNHYEVIYDFEIRVPYGSELEVSTVTDGDVEVSDIGGDFRIHNVNGAIEMARMGGSGEATTVNGSVVASFVSNPSGDSHFETVNGKIDVSFQPGLSADLEMIARWGELWTAYKVAPLPSPPPTQRTEGGRTIIEVPRGTRVRVDGGGPTHSFETLNGNIYVRKGTSERGDNDA
jgi:hypothetical protein